MNKILFVEDDKTIQEANKKMLQRRGGYTVCIAMNLAEARRQVAETKFDIIVLDIILPDGSGLEFLKELRSLELSEAGADTPVLLLTALGESGDVVKGLKAGGDDYLAKPYDNDVLLARIESLLRRTERIPKTLIKGPLTLDIIAGRAFIENNDTSAASPLKRDLLLTQKEFAVLLLLAQNEGSIMSAQTVYSNVWKQTSDIDTNTLQATISNIRKKIEPTGYTITVSRGQGYVFKS